MKQLILSILFILCLSFQASALGPMMLLSGTSEEAVVCTEIYSDNFGDNDVLNIAQNVLRPWVGWYFTPTADMDVCKIDVWIDGIVNVLGASHEYYVEIWSLSGGNLDTKLGQSSKLEGSLFSANTYISANAGFAEFSSSVPLTGSTKYAIVMILGSDATPGDSPPEVDADNYPRVGYDNENDGSGEDSDGAQGGWVAFDTGKGAQETDAEDDVRMEIWSDQ